MLDTTSQKFFLIDRCSNDLLYWQKEKKTGFNLYVKHNTYSTCYSKRYYTSSYELHFFVCRFGVTYRGKIGDDIEVRVGNAVERLVSVPSHIKHQKDVRKIGAIWGHFATRSPLFVFFNKNHWNCIDVAVISVDSWSNSCVESVRLFCYFEGVGLEWASYFWNLLAANLAATISGRSFQGNATGSMQLKNDWFQWRGFSIRYPETARWFVFVSKILSEV